MNKKKSVCRICRKESKLTFEHIPPHGAFNKGTSKVINGENMLKTVSDRRRLPWDYSELKYDQQQRGFGCYSLCSNCNNNTGAWYADEYIAFAHIINELINRVDLKEALALDVFIEQIRPLRIAKQIITMIATTCDNLTEKHPEIKKLIMEKNYKGIDPSKIRISMYGIRSYRFAYSGINAMLSKGKTTVLAYLDVYPLGFVIEFDPNLSERCLETDITSWFNNYDYDEKINVNFILNIFERNTMFPRDYRKKEEIIKDSEKSILQTCDLFKKEALLKGTEEESIDKFIDDYKAGQILNLPWHLL